MKRCLDEETIQRLLDGELRVTARRSAEAHAAGCPTCLEAVCEAGREEALVSSFFAPRLFDAIPTERLWGGILNALSGDGPAARCKR